MRRLFLSLLLIFTCLLVFSQTPGVQLSRKLGGTRADAARDVQKTSDGGLLVAGTTSSNDFDVTGLHGDSTDLWLVKLSSKGNIEWQKCFGGTGPEAFGKLLCQADGSALLLGVTSSNNGDVEGAHGYSDLWAIKIDASGNVLWKKTLGGSFNEGIVDALLTSDNGYIIAGHTDSNDGDVSGSHGAQDIWIVKLNYSGDLEWQKAIGGTINDWGQSIVQNVDGSYVLTGYTASNNGDFTVNRGLSDIWVVKLTSSGTIAWAKTYGGTNGDSGYDLIMAQDGSIVVLGHTSSVNGDVIGKTTSDRDLWILNLDYTNGNLNWQKVLGGSGTEMPIYMIQDSDGMFLVSGHTGSTNGHAATNHGGNDVFLARLESNGNIIWTKCFGGPSDENMNNIYDDTTAKSYVFISSTLKGGGDVTGYHHSDIYLNVADAWLVKVNYNGSIEWQRCLGGTVSDYLFAVRKTSATTYILAGTSSSADGDVPLNRGLGDAWVVQLGPVNTIKGTLFLDNNLNGVKDAGELFYSVGTVKSKKLADSVSTISYNGLFINYVDTGAYVTTLSLNRSYYNVVPTSFSSNFTSYFNTDSLSFVLQPIPNKQDLSISIIPLNTPRPGFSSSYRVFFRNEGTTTMASGEILFKRDSRANFLSASPAVNSTNGDTLKWSYTNFAPGDTASILINLQVLPPPTVNNGDTLSFKAIVTPVSEDETPSNDTAILKQRVVGSFDPNDKIENNGGVVSSSFISNGDYLQYTVRFQNTGTAEAYFVTVRDTLGNRVDLSTLEIITASHPYTLTIENGNQLIWQFDNIMLPASSIDEPGSHGYIVYRIRPKSDVVVGETIHNTASIYFDYNLPVLTNDATTLVQDNFSALPVQLISFTGQLNNNAVQLQWKVGEAKNFERFEVERSLDGRNYSKIETVSFANSIVAYNTTDNISILQPGQIFYRLKLVDADGKFGYSKVIVFRTNSPQSNFIVYPNPARTELFVSLSVDKKQNLSIKVLDASGRTLLNQQKEIQKGNNVFPVNTTKLKAGSYLLQIVVDGKSRVSRFTIMN